MKYRIRVKMGRQRLNAEGLKMYDPSCINFPWIYEMKKHISAMTVDKPWTCAPRPRVRVKAPTRMIGSGVPDDAQPGDLVVGNRGAAARVYQPISQFGGLSACLTLEYVGNYYSGVVRPAGPRGGSVRVERRQRAPGGDPIRLSLPSPEHLSARAEQPAR